MKVSVIGTGYVGLSTGVCLAEIGHEVVCIDIDEDKIEKLQTGLSPIFEPGIEKFLKKNIKAKTLTFTTSYEAGLCNAEIIIITVGTPQGNNGKPDLTYLEAAAKEVAIHLTKDIVIVIKSTVPVGTNEHIKKLMMENCLSTLTVDIVSNPEFLREGSAILDTLKADRIIIGSENIFAANKVKQLYSPLNIPVVKTDLKSAEMIKYASNAFLAMKISYINEIANLSEIVGADVMDVAIGMGLDKRIGESFLRPGIGYGGSCFPKDVMALYQTANEKGMPFNLLKETIQINSAQQEILVRKAQNRFGTLKDKKIAILGLAFKPGTDDIREAPSIRIINALKTLGASISTFDPAAMENIIKEINDNSIDYCSSILDATAGADAMFIVTEWNEIKNMNLSNVLENMKQKIIFDGRNCISDEQINSCTYIEYYPVGRHSVIKNS